MTYRLRGLWAAVIVHMTYNLTSLFISLLAKDMPADVWFWLILSAASALIVAFGLRAMRR